MIKSYLFLFFVLLLGTGQLFAEGSVDFINYPGHRLFLRSDKDQQIKAYAKAGEFLNVGSSHCGFDVGSIITVYRPDGTLHSVFDGSDGTTGIIFNNVQELNGPVGAAGNGYTPGVVAVTPATEGIWSIVFSVSSHTGAAFNNLLNNAPWTRAANQPTNRRVILSWDVTVTQDNAGPAGGTFLSGRVFTQEYNSMISENGTTTSPTFFVLTPDGLQYSVDFNETDPWGFPLSSSSLGLLQANQNATYKSWHEEDLIRSDDPTTWTQGNIYQYEPQAEDYGDLINNKIFFNVPNPDMPTSAVVADIFRDNTYVTWLYTEPFVFDIIFNDFSITGTDEDGVQCTTPGLQFNQGAFFIFNSNLPGTVALELDINNDGDLDDPADRLITGFVNAGIDSLYWDGGDGQGNPIPVQDNFTFGFSFYLRGGENHIMLSDVENNVGGVTFTLLSDVGAVETDQFYYDHSEVGGPVSGGGPAGTPYPTNVPFTYDNNFGNKKALDYWAYVVYGDEGDGNVEIVIDIVGDCTEDTDSDGDGVADKVDLDDDNDGIPDYLEYCHDNSFACLPGGFDPSHDEDSDGIFNYRDADDPAFTNPCLDENANGICDRTDKIYDADEDGIINSLDLDSDNDGIFDLYEAEHAQTDADRNGVIDGDTLLFGLNGFYNPLASEPDSSFAVAIYEPSDQDGDGFLDAYDLDTDNDGILDIAEAGHDYPDGDDDGHFGSSFVLVDNRGVSLQYGENFENPIDKDNDGIDDFRDSDSDNDTFLDVGENRKSDPDDDGRVGNGLTQVNADGVPVAADDTTISVSALTDQDGDGVPDFHDLDSDNDGINDVREYRVYVVNSPDSDDNGLGGINPVTVDANGILTAETSGSNPADTDGDGLADVWDLDTDNDGINDVREAGHADPDSEGIVGTGTPFVNADGQITVTQLGVLISSSELPNTDMDLRPDYADLDSDNDGINDVEEGGNEDPDDDGIVGTGIPSVNADGQPLGSDNTALSGSLPPETDGDLIPDYLDLDSDNDGINDVTEALLSDPDNDGTVGLGSPVTNADGQPAGATSQPADTDTDDVRDYLDLDSDNDGINDVEEGGNPDPDNNGFILTGIPAVNTFGQAFGSTSAPLDTDEDTYPDYLDLDTDNDGINDTEEAGFDDPDDDGIVGIGIPTVNNFGQAPGTNSFPDDTDLDAVKDYRDLDSDNDGINDVEEGGLTDPDNDGLVGTGMPPVNQHGQPAGATSSPDDTDGDGYADYHDLDSDNDAINDTEEAGFDDPDNDGVVGTGIPVVNADGQPDGATSDPTDTDEDGTPDYHDLDSDNDLISDVVEGGNEDPDDDGIVGTGTPPVNEHGQPDGATSDPTHSDDDGIPDYQDPDSDDDGIVDIYECPDDNTCVDTDDDGTPDYQDPDSDDDGINDEDECETGADCVDTDNDGDPDYVDIDTDNDGLPDDEECPDGAPCPDNDGDGIPDWRDPLCILTVEAITGGGTYCEGETVTLTAETNATGETLNFTWTNLTTGATFTGSAESDEDLTLVLLNANSEQGGLYNLTVADLAANCAFISPPVSINIASAPDQPTLTADNSNLCAGGELILNTDSADDEAVSFLWYFDDGSGPVLLTETSVHVLSITDISAAQSGNYSVVISENGCPSPESGPLNVTVTEPVTEFTAVSSAGEDNPACLGTDVTLSVTEYPDATVQWFAPDGTVVGNDFTITLAEVTLAEAGEYYAVLFVPACEEVTSNSVQVNVITVPDTPEIAISAAEVCAGESAVLTTDEVSGTNVQYEWYADYGNGPMLIITTMDPMLVIGNAETADAGLYFLIISSGECSSDNSSTVSLEVFESTESIALTNNTDADNPACNGEDITLSIPPYDNASIQWFGPNGAFATVWEVTLTDVSEADAGEYFAVVTFEFCGEVTSDVSEVFVQDNNIAPELMADNDELCAGQSASLFIMNDLGIGADDEVTYTWFNALGEAVGNSADPDFIFENVQNEGEVSVAVTINGCTGAPGAFFLTVGETPDETALIADNTIYFCADDNLELRAVAPTQSNGTWRSLGTATVLNPEENITAVANLTDGANLFVYALSTDECGEFSTDTVTVFAPARLEARDDMYQIEAGDRLTDADAAANDLIENAPGVIYSVVSEPANGAVTMNEAGVFTYVPTPDFGGEDSFIYEVCSTECPDDCVEAVVSINVRAVIDCFVPNGITPNGDGSNDFLEIPCLHDDAFPNNHFMVFNRWGDKVFDKVGYANDWTGTYQNRQLPAGTYFYILETEPGAEPLQDFFTIVY